MFNEVLRFRKSALTLIFSLIIFALVQKESINDIKILCFVILAYAFINAFFSPLQDIYEYIAGDKSKFEFAYLERVTKQLSLDNEKLVRAFDSFWYGAIEYNEYRYIQLFAKLVTNNLDKKNYTSSYALLNSFCESINKRNFYHLLQNFYPKLLEWHWNFFIEPLDSQERGINGYYESHSVIQKLFYIILDKAVLEDYAHSFNLCIGLFKKHIDTLSALPAFDNKKFDYLREFFQKYFDNLLKNFDQNAFNGTDVWGKNSTTIKEWQFLSANMVSSQSSSFNIFCLFKNWLFEKISYSKTPEHFAKTGLLIHYIFREQDPEVMKTFFIYFYLKTVKYADGIDQNLLDKINVFARLFVPIAYTGLTENPIEKEKNQRKGFELIDAILKCDENTAKQITQIQAEIKELLDKNLVWHDKDRVNALLLEFINSHEQK